MRPSRFSRIGALCLFLLAGISIPLAYGPAPEIPLEENPIVVMLFVVLGCSITLFVIPFLLKWNWRIQYFGCTALCIGSFSFLAIVPCMVLFLYGSAPRWLDLLVLSLYVVTHILWCRKFFVIYNHVYSSNELRSVIYQEEADAVYYLQRGDKYILDSVLRFSQAPSSRYFVLFMGAAVCMIPLMDYVKQGIGIPFAHIFLIVAALPISWMCVGLTVRGYLIFYRYPSKIKKATGKDVYVDLVGSHQNLEKSAIKQLRKLLT